MYVFEDCFWAHRGAVLSRVGLLNHDGGCVCFDPKCEANQSKIANSAAYQFLLQEQKQGWRETVQRISARNIPPYSMGCVRRMRDHLVQQCDARWCRDSRVAQSLASRQLRRMQTLLNMNVSILSSAASSHCRILSLSADPSILPGETSR